MCPEGIPFYTPWITNQDKKAISEVLKSRWLTGGPIAVQFEKQFADYVGVKYAVSVSSCTAALHLAMRVLNIKPGDEVIVPDVTFAATANAPLFVGATPVFADIDEKTFNISPKVVTMTPGKRANAIAISMSAVAVTQTGHPGPDTISTVGGSSWRIPFLKMETV